MEKRQVLGLTEKIVVYGSEKKKTMKARIDSGATRSSIDIKLAAQLNIGRVVSSTLVKSASGSKIRPIAKVTVNIHGREFTSQFTLAERSHMTYPLLIGQNVLKKGRFLIDPLKP